MDCSNADEMEADHVIQSKETRLNKAAVFIRNLYLRNPLRSKRQHLRLAARTEAGSGFDSKGEIEDTSYTVPPASQEIDGTCVEHELDRFDGSEWVQPRVELFTGHVTQLEMGLSEHEYRHEVGGGQTFLELCGSNLSDVSDPVASQISPPQMTERVELVGNDSPDSVITSPSMSPIVLNSSATKGLLSHILPPDDSRFDNQPPLHPLTPYNADDLTNVTIPTAQYSNYQEPSSFSPFLFHGMRHDSGTCGDCNDHTSSNQAESILVNTDAQELQKVYEIFAFEWVQRLALTRDPPSLHGILQGSALFAHSLKVLQSCLHGSLPQSFQEAFALLLLACASAYMLHRDDVSYDWDGLIVAMYQCQHALVNDKDKCVLLRVIGVFLPAVALPSAPTLNDDQYSLQSSETVQDAFRQSPIIQECLLFLDGKSIWRLICKLYV